MSPIGMGSKMEITLKNLGLTTLHANQKRGPNRRQLKILSAGQPTEIPSDRNRNRIREKNKNKNDYIHNHKKKSLLPKRQKALVMIELLDYRIFFNKIGYRFHKELFF